MGGLCKDCRHWQRDHRNSEPGDYGACQLTVVMAGSEARDDVKFWAGCTCDDEQNNHWIETDEDFGCVQWESVSPAPSGELRERIAKAIVAPIVREHLSDVDVPALRIWRISEVIADAVLAVINGEGER